MREETGSKVEEYTDQDLQDMLPIYYKRLFPHKPFYRWLSYGLCKYSMHCLLIVYSSLQYKNI